MNRRGFFGVLAAAGLMPLIPKALRPMPDRWMRIDPTDYPLDPRQFDHAADSYRYALNLHGIEMEKAFMFNPGPPVFLDELGWPPEVLAAIHPR